MKKIVILFLASIISILLMTSCTNLQSYMEQENTLQHQSH